MESLGLRCESLYLSSVSCYNLFPLSLKLPQGIPDGRFEPQHWTMKAGELMEKPSPLRQILLLSKPAVPYEVILEECPRE